MTGSQQVVSEIIAGLVALPIVVGIMLAAVLGRTIPSSVVALSATVVAFYFGSRVVGATVVTLGNGAPKSTTSAPPTVHPGSPSAAPAPTAGTEG